MKAIPMWLDRKAGGCAISIETQAACNWRCPECPRTLDPTKSRFTENKSITTRMPTEKVRDLINQAADMGWKGPIHFSHYSEPLIDRRFVLFCRYAKRRGLIPELFTNGSHLTEKLISEIDGLVPYIVLSFRTPGSEEFWQSLFKKSRVRITDKYQVLIWNPKTKLLEDAINRVIDKPCVGPLFTAFRINYDGQMSMCYADFNNEFGLLNAFEHSLEELWFGEEHVAAVREMGIAGARRRRALCSGCPEVYPDKGSYVSVRKPPLPPDDWLRRLGVDEDIGR
jgi:MoaA/NifB/PqqE/SkfB family radical SAM enzyme